MKKDLQLAKIFVIGLVFGLSTLSALAFPPPANPPSGNVYGPINVGPNSQTKSGLFGAGNVYSNNNIFAGAVPFSDNYPGSLSGGAVSATWFCLPPAPAGTGGSSGTGPVSFNTKNSIFGNIAEAAPAVVPPTGDCVTTWADVLSHGIGLPTGTISQTLRSNGSSWIPTSNLLNDYTTGKVSISQNGQLAPATTGTLNVAGPILVDLKNGSTSNSTSKDTLILNGKFAGSSDKYVSIVTNGEYINFWSTAGSPQKRANIFAGYVSLDEDLDVANGISAGSTISTGANIDASSGNVLGMNGIFTGLGGSAASNICANSSGKLIICP
ncbi:MAG: hypothetical protein V4504_01270 [Patescibacteria group bacterium]